MRIQTVAGHERGFTILEMVIAIMVTLIIMGAVYGLLAQGQNAFRREPEISDRQQQIRIAMDLIQRDIMTAGMSLPEWVQAFTTGLDAAGPPNAQGAASDYLELIGNDGACTPVALCSAPVAGASVDTSDPLPACYSFPLLVAARPGVGAGASIGQATGPNGAGACVAGGLVAVGLPAGPLAWNIPGGRTPGPNAPGDMRPIQIVRYEIAVDAAGVPSLWRSARGGLNAALAFVAPGAGADWQLVATGIEDFQVQYRNGVGLPGIPVWLDDPGAVVVDGYGTLVREVRVTLVARTTGQANLQGESFSATGVGAIRGSLTTVTSPRAALFALSVGPPLPPAPGSEQLWQ